ncbi:hypothetical protein A2U01_0050342, partial [Trifolium medium]|nr:hypothetical protein [Trifolium medium]
HVEGGVQCGFYDQVELDMLNVELSVACMIKLS